MRSMKNLYPFLFLLPVFAHLLGGCAPVVVGAGAAGTYKAATDERSVGRQLDDVAISSRIKLEMIGESRVKARLIEVHTVDGVVYLNGYAESAAEKNLAGEIAGSVAGVREVRNQLEIGSRTVGEALNDQLIAARIKANLIMDEEIKALNIEVDVFKGVAVLTGMVADLEQKRKAAAIAAQSKGVRTVRDFMTVK